MTSPYRQFRPKPPAPFGQSYKPGAPVTVNGVTTHRFDDSGMARPGYMTKPTSTPGDPSRGGTFVRSDDGQWVPRGTPMRGDQFRPGGSQYDPNRIPGGRGFGPRTGTPEYLAQSGGMAPIPAMGAPMSAAVMPQGWQEQPMQQPMAQPMQPNGIAYTLAGGMTPVAAMGAPGAQGYGAPPQQAGQGSALSPYQAPNGYPGGAAARNAADAAVMAQPGYYRAPGVGTGQRDYATFQAVRNSPEFQARNDRRQAGSTDIEDYRSWEGNLPTVFQTFGDGRVPTVRYAQGVGGGIVRPRDPAAIAQAQARRQQRAALQADMAARNADIQGQNDVADYWARKDAFRASENIRTAPLIAADDAKQAAYVASRRR